MATANQIKVGVGSYIQRALMPRMDGKRQFLVGMAYSLFSARVDEIMRSASGSRALKALGVISDNGEIDIDKLYEAASAQMQQQGKLPIDIPLVGSFTFDANDLGELYRAIKEAV